MKLHTKIFGLPCACLLLLSGTAFGQQSFVSADPSFGGTGSITVNDPRTGKPAGVADTSIGSDGNLYLLIGTNQLARVTSSGNLDNQFGTNGFTVLSGLPNSTSPASASALVVDVPGNRIYVAFNSGQSAASVAAFDLTGAKISSFGSGGVATFASGTSVYPTALQLAGNGKLLVAGHRIIQAGDQSLFVAELAADGTPITGFGTGGITEITVPNSQSPSYAISYKSALDPSGNIYVAGGTAGNVGLIARFTPSGAIDSAFGTNGLVAYPLGNGVQFGEFEVLSIDGSGNVNAFGNYLDASNANIAAVVTLNNTGATLSSISSPISTIPYFPNYTLASDGKILLSSGQQRSNQANSPNLIRLNGDSRLAAPAPASATITTSGGPLTVRTAAGGLSNLRTVDQPNIAPTAFQYPFGWLAYDITGLSSGSSVQVTFTIPNGTTATGYVKCASGSCTPVRSTNLSVSGNSLTVTLTDGGFGDADGAANGVISDPGALSVAASSPAPGPSPTPAPSPGPTLSSSRGGGTFGLLPLIAGVFGLAMKRRRNVRKITS